MNKIKNFIKKKWPLILLIILLIPLSYYIIIYSIDSYFYSNSDARNKAIKQVATKYVQAIEENDQELLTKLTKEEDHCLTELEKMKQGAYKDFLGKDISNLEITVTTSNHEDVSSFEASFEVTDNDEKKTGKIIHSVFLERGRFLICGIF